MVQPRMKGLTCNLIPIFARLAVEIVESRCIQYQGLYAGRAVAFTVTVVAAVSTSTCCCRRRLRWKSRLAKPQRAKIID